MATSAAAPDYLGELTIAPGCDGFYPLGELLAQLNEVGLLLIAGFEADFRLRPATGEWVLCEADHVVLGGFGPDQAAAQFRHLSGDPLRAVLSGYAWVAQRRLDPRYPGFTAGLLAELLPAPVPAGPPPLVSGFDLTRVWQACGASLQLGSAEPRLQLQLQPPPLAGPPAAVTDEELLLASVVVFVAELDLPAWLKHVAACHPASEAAQLLGALARGKLYDSEWGGVLAQAAAYFRPQRRLRQRLQRYGPWSLLLNLFAVVYARPDQLPALRATHSEVRFLRQALDALPAADLPRRGAILLAVRNGLVQLAGTAEAEGQAKESLNFAQLALIVAQLLPPSLTPAYAEAWLRDSSAQEESYGWLKLGADELPPPTMVWRLAGYAGTAAMTMRLFCEASGQWLAHGQARNQLWSAAWRGHSLLRTALRRCHALGQQEMRPGLPPPPPHDQAVMLKNLLGHYIDSIKTLLDMSLRSAELAQAVSIWAGGNTENTSLKTIFAGYPDRYVAVRDALNAHGYGPEAVHRLGELLAELQL